MRSEFGIIGKAVEQASGSQVSAMRHTFAGSAAQKRRAGFEELLRRPNGGAPGVQVLTPSTGVWLARAQAIADSWQAANRKAAGLIHAVPPALRPYFELQFTVNRLALETNLITRLGDAASSTVRQLQQMGSR